MYYYIIEPPRGKLVSRQEKIKDILGDLGIAGETVSPSAARTIEELTHLGVIKGYSTIVAVGSESLTNKVITALAAEKISNEIVLGIIPDDFSNPLAKKIGVSDLRSACETLKFRKLSTIDICLIEPNKYFITSAEITSGKNNVVYFSFEKVKGRALIDNILIKPGLEIFLHDRNLEGNASIQFYNWLFGKKREDIFSSFFKVKRIRIEAEDASLPVKVSGEIVAKTPVTFHNRSKILKIIVSRDKMRSESKESKK